MAPRAARADLSIDWEGRARARTALCFSGTNPCLLDGLGDGRLKLAWDNGLTLNALGRVRYESELEPRTYAEARLREVWARYETEDVAVILGRQQVVWGKTDGIQLLDVVHPLDQREFLLDNWTDMRIPLWMANVELRPSATHEVQILVIPWAELDRTAMPGGRFSLWGAETAGIPIEKQSEPGRGPRDWEYGVRWGFSLADANITLNALQGWANQPERRLEVHEDGGLLITQKPVREFLAGLSAERTFGEFVLRVESTFVPRSTVQVVTDTGLPYPDQVPQWRWALGADRFFGEWFASAQIFEQLYFPGGRNLLESTSNHVATVLVDRSFMQDTLHLRTFAAMEFEHPGYWIFPRVSYQLWGRLDIGVGADLFGGDSDGIFGRFNRQSRLRFELEYKLGSGG